MSAVRVRDLPRRGAGVQRIFDLETRSPMRAVAVGIFLQRRNSRVTIAGVEAGNALNPLAFENRGKGVRQRLAGKRRAAVSIIEEDATECPRVGALVEPSPACLLRAHRRWCRTTVRACPEGPVGRSVIPATLRAVGRELREPESAPESAALRNAMLAGFRSGG